MSRPFKFRLEPVRDVRVDAEERAKQQLAIGLGKRERSVAMLNAAQQRLDHARSSDATESMATASDGTFLATRQAYIERLERSRRDAIVLLEQQDKQLRCDRLALVRATQKREVLDRLKSNRRQDWNVEQGRIEAAAIDEMASRIFTRRAA